VTEKIKVLHLIKSLGRGGAEMLLPETLKLHSKDQFEFHYMYFLPWKNQMVDALIKNSGRVICLDAKNNLAMLLQVRKVANYVKQQNIAIIHCHLPWAGFVGRLVHKFTGIPVIYTEHNKQERYHWLTFILNKVSFNTQNLAIAVSADVANSIVTNINPKIKVQTILNGVNTTLFQRKDFSGNSLRELAGFPANATVVGTVAVFRFQKRLDLWLEEFAAVCSQFPNVYGVIVGDGPLKAEIISKRKALGLEGKVYMAGLQTEVRPWMAAMDIFMMSSLYEGLPIALLEAMSMECAIVSTDAGGIKEVIRHGEDGLLVPTDSPSDLRHKLTEMLTDLDSRKKLAHSARQRVLESFSLSVMVADLEKIYHKYRELHL
jgi:glycosyltransferase involved in cell wall biosynthesis